ncbi:hypothetical protein COCOBI_19-2350 [Coccomyxa sp. Obi]|nr:hypothetical protein COCOBI_19-2350 [Coccomyxa sp. Obi]
MTVSSAFHWLGFCLMVAALLCQADVTVAKGHQGKQTFVMAKSRRSQKAGVSRPLLENFILVSYSYFEKDDIQVANMKFFTTVGMGMSIHFKPPRSTDFALVINGNACTPCKALQPYLRQESRSRIQGVSEIWSTKGIVMLHRTENEGMDFAAHNVTIEWTRWTGRQKKYRYYIFLNSSVRGPFYPSYMGPRWQWTEAFTNRLKGNIKVVASSLVCLPEIDAGGYGPKVESWAFATDAVAVQLIVEAGVFNVRKCKLCRDGVVVMGEYGISKTLLNAGYNIATLMSMYPVGVDWSKQEHWRCNNNTHPSRHGTYDGITMHPFETVFIKASWHVGEPYLGHYTRWFMAHADGSSNTGGHFNEALYRYAISEKAQEAEMGAGRLH